MQFTQIRNATLKINYAGKKILIDPWLAEKGAVPGFGGTINDHIRNPTSELPMPVNEIVDVDAVILTHDHPDHWDEAAKNAIPKDMPFFVQHEKDAQVVKSAGFSNIRVLGESNEYEGITLIKTLGQHGKPKVLKDMKDLLGEVSGIVFKHPDEKTLYIAGDTVWCQAVEDSLKQLELSQFDGHFFMESSESRPVKADCNLSRFYFSHSVFSQNCLVISIPARNACELGCTMTRSR